MSDNDVDRLITDVGSQLQELMADRGLTDPVMIGIHTGGVWIAERLHEQLRLSEPLGTLDIAFYRDDFSRIGVQPRVRPSRLPFYVGDRHILLVDDVLYSGRTVRAALNEIFDYGRPASVTLAVLIDRGGRELPICAAAVGKHMPLARKQQIKLRGPEPLELTIKEQ